MNTVWKVSQTDEAKRDYASIIRWSLMHFGPDQTRSYKETIKLAVAGLKADPDLIGVRRRDDLPAGVLLLHVAREGRKGSHFIVFRISGENVIDVLRILHDKMDFPAHLP